MAPVPPPRRPPPSRVRTGVRVPAARPRVLLRARAVAVAALAARTRVLLQARPAPATGLAARPRVLSRTRAVGVAALAAAGSAAALPAGASAAACKGENRTVASQGAAKAEAAVRCLVNRERAKVGLKALRYDSRAARAAQRHTDDMVERRSFDHTAPGGSTVADRVTATGLGWSSLGENIAVGQRTPAAVMRGWMKSPGHRANILDARFSAIGIGASRRGTKGFGGATWTQVLVRPR